MIKPRAQAAGTCRRLLRPASPRADENGIREHVPGQIGRRVEQQRVVFGKVPLHIVTGLVHPVAVTEHGGIDLRD